MIREPGKEHDEIRRVLREIKAGPATTERPERLGSVVIGHIESEERSMTMPAIQTGEHALVTPGHGDD
jgi:hypothetical protein